MIIVESQKSYNLPLILASLYAAYEKSEIFEAMKRLEL